MTTPTPSRPPNERVPTRRVLFWAALGVLLVVGLVLFFLYGQAVTPVLEPNAVP